MFTPPNWFQLTPEKVRADSRLQPFMLVASFNNASMDADIAARIPTQAGIVFRRISIAARPLGTSYALTDDQKDSIIEAVKLKLIQSITATDPSETMIAVSRAAKNEAEDILKGLETEFADLAATALKSSASAGSIRFSRFHRPGVADPVMPPFVDDFNGTSDVPLLPGHGLDDVLIANNPPYYD